MSHHDERSDAGDLLEEVYYALHRRKTKDVFAIGGTIDLNQTIISVVIRWDSGVKGSSFKVSLPVGSDAASSNAFHQMLKDCQPATFGKGSEEVLDEAYRKAGKLDVTEFCTDFNLANHAVMNTVTQALVCSALVGDELNGVRAELYKLNVSRFSGCRKAYANRNDRSTLDPLGDSNLTLTPLGQRIRWVLSSCACPMPTKVGDLIFRFMKIYLTNLPGGALAIRHSGQDVLFDWSSEQTKSIQWAAFFSDCEHEVLEVTDGHRVTLAYNLYRTDHGPSLMAKHLSALDQPSLHFLLSFPMVGLLQ